MIKKKNTFYKNWLRKKKLDTNKNKRCENFEGKKKKKSTVLKPQNKKGFVCFKTFLMESTSQQEEEKKQSFVKDSFFFLSLMVFFVQFFV
jgi:hypothetical protein